MTFWAYLFEARAIQEYILDSRDFAEQIAAGKLVESLCEAPLTSALEALGLGDGLAFSRRSAGAFHAVLEGPDAGGKAQRLRDLWGMAVASYCPGLEFVHVLASGETQYDALRKGLRALAGAVHRPAALFPEASPLARRDPRTGRAAVSLAEGMGRPPEWADAVSLRKRHVLPVPSTQNGRFLESVESLLEGRVWPRRFWPEEPGAGQVPGFPWLPDSFYLAVVHIAISEQFDWLKHLGEAAGTRRGEFARVFRVFSESVEVAFRRAALMASAAVLAPASAAGPDGIAALPAWPVLLRDGEFTALVRADLALSFAAVFLAEFEHESVAALEALAPNLLSPGPPLSASAGIAFLKAGRPLAGASHLAESLCRRAQAEAAQAQGDGRHPSGLAFGLLNGYQAESGEAAFLAGGPSGYVGLSAYGIAEGHLPCWKPLEALAALFAEEELAIGPTRQLLGLLALAPPEAAKQYRRWRGMVGKALPQRLERLDHLLSALGIPLKDLPVFRRGGAVRSPVADALLLRAVGHAQSPHT